MKEAITTGQEFPSKSLALMAVALEAIIFGILWSYIQFKACKRLHQRKELNENLLPAGKEIATDLLGELDDEEFLPFLMNKVGSSKRKRLYDRKVKNKRNKHLIKN